MRAYPHCADSAVSRASLRGSQWNCRTDHAFPCRVLRDVEAVRQEASLLRDQMQIVKEDIKKVCEWVWYGVLYLGCV